MNVPTDRAKDLFLDALALDGPADRGTFLDRACAGDACLRADVEGLLAHHAHYPTWVYIPALGRVPLGPLWYVLLFFIIAGCANGVNLTDGLDGLASGTGIISLFTFMAMSVIAFIRSSTHPGLRSDSRLDLALLAAAVLAAVGLSAATTSDAAAKSCCTPGSECCTGGACCGK